jgi:hypothetical protein
MERRDTRVLWDHILTESGMAELELMTGAYSDNQPDYSWLQPLESKNVRFYWFPIRQLGGVKFANLEGARTRAEAGRKGLLNTSPHTSKGHAEGR